MHASSVSYLKAPHDPMSQYKNGATYTVILKPFNFLTISRIFIIYFYILKISSYFIEVNLFIRIPVKTLLDLVNCCSTEVRLIRYQK